MEDFHFEISYLCNIELFTMSCPSWVALHGIAHGFTELCKPLCHDKAVIHEGNTSIRIAKLQSPENAKCC